MKKAVLFDQEAMLKREGHWLPVIALADVPSYGFITVDVGEHSLLLSKLANEVRCFANQCAHSAYALTFAKCEGQQLICPFHHYRFSLEDGRCVSHLCAPLSRYPIRMTGQTSLMVEVYLPLNLI